ncbi:MAG TPA: hypothetical protein VGD71_32765 [Kribbella sp.]|jgi:hypothetical protein
MLAMFAIEIFLAAGFTVTVAILVVCVRSADDSDPEFESSDWPRADAEVLSVLRAGGRTFLLVRFPVGTSLIRNDVLYPLPGATPRAGQRVPIRYDPEAPARVAFDLHAAGQVPASG